MTGGGEDVRMTLDTGIYGASAHRRVTVGDGTWTDEKPPMQGTGGCGRPGAGDPPGTEGDGRWGELGSKPIPGPLS